MADRLTQEELDAIAAYRGPVQVIPRGVSGISTDGRAWRDACAQARGRRVRSYAFRKSREIDETIRELWAAGVKDADIAVKVKLSEGAVVQRRNRMGIMGDIKW